MEDLRRAPGAAGDRLDALVLGVGGNVSQGIMKALRMSALDVRIVGACVTGSSAGLHVADRAYVGPYADDPAFPGWLLEVCETEAIDVVLSGVEPVLRAVSERATELRERTGAITLVSDPATLEIGADKLLTARWLAEKGLNHPRTVDAANADAVNSLAAELGLPLIAKPRRGKGARGLMELHDERDLAWAAGRDEYVVQELFADDHSEYTVGCFSDREGRVRGALALRRRLEDGTTAMAEAGDFGEVRAEAERIATALRPVGPSNIQLRVHRERPICFEINVRFSGTAPIRARLGFNDVEAAIRHYVLGEPAIDLPPVRDGIAVRYWNEIYLNPDDVLKLERGRLDDPRGRQADEFGQRR